MLSSTLRGYKGQSDIQDGIKINREGTWFHLELQGGISINNKDERILLYLWESRSATFCWNQSHGENMIKQHRYGIWLWLSHPGMPRGRTHVDIHAYLKAYCSLSPNSAWIQGRMHQQWENQSWTARAAKHACTMFDEPAMMSKTMMEWCSHSCETHRTHCADGEWRLDECLTRWRSCKRQGQWLWGICYQKTS